MLPYFTRDFGNPSSSHEAGRAAAAAIAAARSQVGALIGAGQDGEILFTSGATEANNTALLQALGQGERNEIVVSAVEHPSILSALPDLEKQHGLAVHRIGVDANGRLDMASFERALNRHTALVSIMWANNETGSVFAVAALAEMAHRAGALFHSDAVQAAGKLAIDVKSTAIDMLSLSAHKCHGPKGVGALYLRKAVKFRALLRGGRQERARRAGTENVPAIVGFGKAAELARLGLKQDMARVVLLRDWLERSVCGMIPETFVLGDRSNRLPNISMLAFDGADGEEILHRLDRADVAASAGSACASGVMQPSHVLRAMRVPYRAAQGAVRFSLSRETSEADVNALLDVLPEIVLRARAASPFAGRHAAAAE